MQYKILQNRKLYEDIGKPGFNPEYVLQWTSLNSANLKTNFEGELAQWQSTHPLIQMFMVRFRARSHTGVMDYDEACFMHLTPGVVHNFSKAVVV